MFIRDCFVDSFLCKKMGGGGAKRAKQSLLNAKNTAASKLSGEFLASDLRFAETALAEIIGEVIPEDILNNIFSKFCIGK